MALKYIGFIILGFCVGSIPWGYIIVKLFKKTDIRKYGSGNIGATNVWRLFGKQLGILVFILDSCKGFLPVFWVNNYFGINPAISCGVGTILGHTCTPWLKFRGGKGVATGLGVFIGIAPIQAIIAFCVWGFILLTSRWVSVASIGASVALVILIFLEYHSSPIFYFVLVGFLIVVFFHRSNIKRLIRGEEPKIF